MAEYSELIRKFEKIRDYMRDFYIYGFKSRNDFTEKSSRTYDNERRRIESYMKGYMKWDYTKNGKTSFISMDCSKISINPLYAAWKSKAFTQNDIMLHFYILDILSKNEMITIEKLTDLICFASNKTFEVQTVRLKCKEYSNDGLVETKKIGKAFYYSLSKNSFENFFNISENLIDAIMFFQGVSVFGEVGSYILDSQNSTNLFFSFKHYYVAHTLEDEILLSLLSAIKNKTEIVFTYYTQKTKINSTFQGVPLKIFISAYTGRRYICLYKTYEQRFFTYRLDGIRKINQLDFFENFDILEEKLNNNLDKVWGVGFGGRYRTEIISFKIFIDEEREQYILDRIKREGHNGKIERLEKNIFLFTKEIFDTNDISPWIKTFVGRIIKIEGTNKIVIDRFYNDIKEMYKMYFE